MLVDAHLTVVWANIIIIGVGVFALTLKYTLNKLSTFKVIPILLSMMVCCLYFYLSNYQYQKVRGVFDATKEEIVLKVTKSNGFGLKSADGKSYTQEKGRAVGISFLFLFRGDVKPAVGSCVRIEINHFVQRRQYYFMNFGKIFTADCNDLMHSVEISKLGGRAMRKKRDYRRSN